MEEGLEQLYMQAPFEDPLWRAAMMFAEVYHDMCENFDKGVCTGVGANGEAVPLNGIQRRIVTDHAYDTRKAIEKKAAEANIPDDMLKAAIRHVGHGNQRKHS